MYREVTVPAEGDQVLDAQVRYQIEEDWDYAYVVVSTNGGADWTPLATNLSTDTSPHGQNFGNGITGSTGGDWVPLTADLSAYAGQTVLLGFRYWTDVAATEPGFQIDAIEIPGLPFDGAETDAGWTYDPADGGFHVTTGTETRFFFNAYVLENRQYLGFDRGLKTGPYNFGFVNTKPDWVEHFPYQDGLLISYWNDQYADNNVGDHPGEGLLLPVDARQGFSHWDDGTLMRPRILSFDSTFGLQQVNNQGLHQNGVRSRILKKPAVPVFDDTLDYWTDCDEHGCTGSHPGRYQPGWYSVAVPKTGTTVQVLEMVDRYSMEIQVN
jgi:immune inhibitor A